MKKINLLMAAGLMASASMQAQVVASLGFEDSDPRNRGSQWALNHQENSFGDWVNTFTVNAKFGAKIYY